MEVLSKQECSSLQTLCAVCCWIFKRLLFAAHVPALFKSQQQNKINVFYFLLLFICVHFITGLFEPSYQFGAIRACQACFEWNSFIFLNIIWPNTERVLKFYKGIMLIIYPHSTFSTPPLTQSSQILLACLPLVNLVRMAVYYYIFTVMLG